LCVIFPGRPRFAIQRLPVVAGRVLAADGFACLRFDLRGHGESDGITTPINRDQPFGEDVAAAIRYLSDQHGHRRFLLVGYCFEALTALDAFRYAADAIEGLFFAAAPVVKESIAAPRQRAAAIRTRLTTFLRRLLRHPFGLFHAQTGLSALGYTPTQDQRALST